MMQGETVFPVDAERPRIRCIEFSIPLLIEFLKELDGSKVYTCHGLPEDARVAGFHAIDPTRIHVAIESASYPPTYASTYPITECLRINAYSADGDFVKRMDAGIDSLTPRALMEAVHG